MDSTYRMYFYGRNEFSVYFYGRVAAEANSYFSDTLFLPADSDPDPDPIITELTGDDFETEEGDKGTAESAGEHACAPCCCG